MRTAVFNPVNLKIRLILFKIMKVLTKKIRALRSVTAFPKSVVLLVYRC